MNATMTRKPRSSSTPSMPTPSLGAILERCRILPSGCWSFVGSSIVLGDDPLVGRTIPTVASGKNGALRVRRVSYQLAHGVKLTPAVAVFPGCNVATCLRPTHLVLVPRADVGRWLDEHPERFVGNGILRCTCCDTPLATHELNTECAVVGAQSNTGATVPHPIR